MIIKNVNEILIKCAPLNWITDFLEVYEYLLYCLIVLQFCLENMTNANFYQ
jgi:hypothetical protein